MGETVPQRSVVTPLVLWLGEPSRAGAALVGQKSARLSEFVSRYPVPDGFCVTINAYRAHLREGGMPQSVKKAVTAAYRRLGERAEGGEETLGPGGVKVAVRSSAVDEDGQEASFAGQHETFLNVCGPEQVLGAIESTWRSARSEAALTYRRDRGLPDEGAAFAVLVQRLVAAYSSGVTFSVDPVSSDPDRIVISANWGLGESLVGGTVNPDRWAFEKSSLSLLEASRGGKERMTIADEQGTRDVNTPTFLRQLPALDEVQALQVARLARELEGSCGWPVDVEFAFDDKRLWLLQFRPVTALASPSVGVSA